MKLKDYFNAHADIWDKTASETDTAKLEKLAAGLKLKKGDVVLDVGTGTGVFLPCILKQVGAAGFVYALDIAEKMLAKARQKNPQSNIKFICGSAEEIPLADGICDSVICYSSFPHFADKLRALREMKRVLKKGGWVYVLHSSSRAHINHIHHNIEAVKHDRLPDPVEMMLLLRNAGFSHARVEDKAENYLAMGKKPV